MIAFRTPVEGVLVAPVVRPGVAENAGLSYAPALSFPRHATAQQVIDTLRQMRPDADSASYLFVTGEAGRLLGTLSLHQLVVAAPETRVEQLMNPNIVALPEDLSTEEQARMLSDSGFSALPVVDAAGRLVGALDAGDLLDAVEEEATEDMYLLAGVDKDEEVSRPIQRAARDRVFWLTINLATAFLAASVVSGFQDVIAHAAVLAAFMPIVAGQGGNAGTQTLTFIVRSLALGEVRMANAGKILLRELTIGICNGVCIGLLVGVLGWLWKGIPALGIVVGVAMLGNLILASLAGVLVPLTLKVLRIDPALASSIFVTTVTDVCGFFIFLSLGMLALQMGYL
ncbi:magnesium transporter [Oscillochloris trichoides DG-6]|uniref:Magnesium transporter MgtE n=1 Tax=Oscillochloris trichoides DG-6 TaxID=765420 RepID=E1IDK2_9CHLR|nr:magnesium transporter [Oscillochloris trichoides]EFO80710.1 magnesium transporter [Oscillochloris trichoides DG-6]